MIQQLKVGTGDRERIVAELADALAAHMAIEEEIFYPVARTVRGNVVLRNYEDHDTEVPVVLRLLASTRDEDAFQARLTVLTELLEMHVSEEENSLFPEVDRAIDRSQSEQLGAEMQARHQQAIRMGHEAVIQMRAARPVMPTGGVICHVHEMNQGQQGQQQGQHQQGQQGQHGQQSQRPGQQSGRRPQDQQGQRRKQQGRRGQGGRGQGPTS